MFFNDFINEYNISFKFIFISYYFILFFIIPKQYSLGFYGEEYGAG